MISERSGRKTVHKTVAEQVDIRFLPWRTETLSNSGITHLTRMRPGHWRNRYSLLPHMPWDEAIIWTSNAPIVLVGSSLPYSSKKSPRSRETATMEYILREVNMVITEGSDGTDWHYDIDVDLKVALNAVLNCTRV